MKVERLFYLTSLSSTFLCLSFRLHKIVCPLTFLFHSPYSEDLRNRLFTRAVPKLFRNGAWMYLMNDCSCTRSRTSKVHIFGKLISNERHAVPSAITLFHCSPLNKLIGMRPVLFVKYFRLLELNVALFIYLPGCGGLVARSLGGWGQELAAG